MGVGKRVRGRGGRRRGSGGGEARWGCSVVVGIGVKGRLVVVRWAGVADVGVREGLRVGVRVRVRVLVRVRMRVGRHMGREAGRDRSTTR